MLKQNNSCKYKRERDYERKEVLSGGFLCFLSRLIVLVACFICLLGRLVSKRYSGQETRSDSFMFSCYSLLSTLYFFRKVGKVLLFAACLVLILIGIQEKKCFAQNNEVMLPIQWGGTIGHIEQSGPVWRCLEVFYAFTPLDDFQVDYYMYKSSRTQGWQKANPFLPSDIELSQNPWLTPKHLLMRPMYYGLCADLTLEEAKKELLEMITDNQAHNYEVKAVGKWKKDAYELKKEEILNKLGKGDTIGDPVNPITGNFFYSHEDLYIPGGGFPIRFIRSYNSQDNNLFVRQVFGIGWTHNFNIHFNAQDEWNLPDNYYVPVASIRDWDGKMIYFREWNGIYYPKCGERSTLSKQDDGSFVWTKRDGIKYYFEEVIPKHVPLLSRIVKPNGHYIRLIYNDNAKLIKIQNDSGYYIDLVYVTYQEDKLTEGCLKSISDSTGRTVSYEYTGTITENRIGKMYLATVTDTLNNKIVYNYMKDDFPYYPIDWISNSSYKPLTKIKDPNGRIVEISYNNFDGSGYFRCCEVMVQSEWKLYDYDYLLWISYDYDKDYGSKTTFIGGNKYQEKIYGYNQIYQYKRTDEYAEYGWGLTVSRITTNCKEIDTWSENVTNKVFTYSPNGLLYQIKDDNGNITKMDYEPNLPYNLTNIIDPLNGTTTFTYHPSLPMCITQIKDPMNNITTFDYYDDGKLGTITDAQGNKTRYFYDTKGNCIQIIDANNQIVTYTYNSNDNLIAIKDPLGNITSFEYDPIGNCKKIIYPNNYTISFNYNADNKITRIIYPDTTISYEYDPVGNIGTMTDSRGVTRYKYDSVDRLVKIIHPDGSVSTYTSTYAVWAQGVSKILVEDANGKATNYAFNSLHQLQEVKQNNEGEDIVTRYSHDPLGNLQSITDAKNRTTVYSYDGLNRLTKVTYPDDTGVEYRYDKNGNLRFKQEPEAKDNFEWIEYRYDNLNRLIYKGTITCLANNNPLTDAIGYATKTVFAYDTYIISPPADLNNPKGNLTMMIDESGTTTYFYNALNRLCQQDKIIDGLKYTTQYHYDKAGNIDYIIDPAGKKTIYTYTNNRITSINVDGIGKIADYTYNPTDAVKSITFNNNIKTDFDYYPTQGWIKKINTTKGTSSVLQRYYKGYDKIGNLLNENIEKAIWNEEYKGNILPENLDWPASEGTGNAVIENDGILHITGVKNWRKEHIYPDEWKEPEEGFCIEFSLKVGGKNEGAFVAFGGDWTGWRSEWILFYPDRIDFFYTRDSISMSTNDSFHTYRIEIVGKNLKFYADDKFKKMIEPFGTSGGSIHPTTLIQIVKWGCKDGAGESFWKYIKYRSSVNPINELPFARYIYDDLYRLEDVNYGDKFLEFPNLSYGYDKVGNREFENKGNDIHSYTYIDNTDRIYSNGVYTYTYDNNGNLKTRSISTATTTYHYDYENRLIKVESPGGLVEEYVYDGFGHRIMKNTAGTKTVYHYNQEGKIICQNSYIGGGQNDSEEIYEEDFENLPEQKIWTTSGLWHQSDKKSYSGKYCFAYNNDKDYNTGGRNFGILTSPIIDLTKPATATLSFWTRWQHESYPYGKYDNMKVEVYDGKSWRQIFYNDCRGIAFSDWHRKSFDLLTYCGKKIQIRFCFDTVDGWYNNYEGWYIDKIEIRGGDKIFFEDDFEETQNEIKDKIWINDGLWNHSILRSNSSVHSFAYNNGANYNTGGRNSGCSLSPLIDLSTLKGNLTLNFWTRWQHESYPYGNYDNMKVDIWDSQKWNRIFYNDCNEGPSVMDWHEESFDISNYAGKKIKLRFNFDTVDGWYNDYEGWYIDDVEIIKGEDKPVYVPLGTISYIYANDELVARVDKKPAQSEKVYYYHNDYLGSTRVMTDSMGEIVWSSDYLPFGELINTEGKIENNFTFTGKEYDEATGLYYFGARYYDPRVGRFITKDPYTGNVYFPPNLHKYIYCYNDPINWIDLWGLCPISPEEQSIIEDWLSEIGLGFLAYLYPTLFSSIVGLSQQAEAPKYDPKPPDGFVENPDRKGSWGKYEDGKFKEKWRFDKGDPTKPGWRGKDHLHFDKKKKHYPPDTPYPGNGGQ
ncbi:MAG: RHS repeat-associated core domain-containing protein [bacterium]